MAKDMGISLLLDFYGDALTSKQQEMMELYYHGDLSLSEITEHVGITRQGVWDSIKRGENTLLDLENKLGLSAVFQNLEDGVSAMKEEIRLLEEQNQNKILSDEVGEITARLKKLLQGIDPAQEELWEKQIHIDSPQ